MKEIFYSVFAALFNICRIFPVKKDRAVFLAPHRGGRRDSLNVLADYTEKEGQYRAYRLTSAFSGKKDALAFFARAPYLMATAKYLFLNDNFMPLSSLRFSKKTVITQLWHAEGAFKRFGLMAPLSPDVEMRERKAGEKLTYVICTSANLKSIYARSFGVSEDKVIPLGSPRTDCLLGDTDRERYLAAFLEEHPEAKGKKLLLYAPTFRDSPEEDGRILSHFDFDRFNREYGETHALLVKLHPQVHSDSAKGEFIDVTRGDISELTLICDALITDYSSVCMDFALLDKGCVFYAYDLDEYDAARSFCFGYEDYVPGYVAKTFDALLDELRAVYHIKRVSKFRDFNFDYTDTGNTKRVYDFVFGNR